MVYLNKTVCFDSQWIGKASTNGLAAFGNEVRPLLARNTCEMFISIFLQRQRQFKAQKHLLLKNRNELMVGMAKCNALSVQYFNMDILDIIQVYGRV